MAMPRHIRRRFQALILRTALLVCLLFAGAQAWAQVPDVPEEEMPVEDELPVDQGVIFNGQNTGAPTDSLKPAKLVRIRTLNVDPGAMFNNLPSRTPVAHSLRTLMEPDLLWRLPGFYNWLGQIGKPYRRTMYGIESKYFNPEGLFLDPFTGTENVQIIHPESGLSFFDTRTPYVNVYYGQGQANLAQLRVDVSQNVHPFINVGLMYFRRNSSGVYKNFSTGHNNLALTANGHTKNERYNAFFSWGFHEGIDEFNGGVEQGFAYEDLFNNSLQPVALSEALLRKYARSLNFKHTFSILNGSGPSQDTTWTADSTMKVVTREHPHSLRLYNSFLIDGYSSEYTDKGLDSTLNQVQFPVYPTFGDSSFFYERYTQSRQKADAGIAYRFSLRRLETGHRFEVAGERITFEKNLHDRALTRFSTMWKGDVRLTTLPFELRGDGKVQNSVTNFFRPETFAELGGSLGILKSVVDYTWKDAGPIASELDSVTKIVEHRPLRIELRSTVHGRNPSMQQAFGAGWAGNRFESDSTLRNTRMNHLRLGIAYQGKSKWERLGELPGNEFALTAFISRLNGVIYYDSSMQLVQTGSSEYLQFLGAEARFRLRLGNFYFEDKTTYQISSSGTGLDTLIGRMQPDLYGKASFYFESRKVKIATSIRVGIDYYYHLSYYAPLYDAPSQQFYPQNKFLQPGYHRLDAYFGTQVKRAYIFLKVAHANESLFAPGYFTTMLHPMLGRTIMLGINWTFFD